MWKLKIRLHINNQFHKFLVNNVSQFQPVLTNAWKEIKLGDGLFQKMIFEEEKKYSYLLQRSTIL